MTQNHIFVQTEKDPETGEIISEEEVEVEPQNLQWAKEQPNLEIADEFVAPDGSIAVVPVSSFESAMAKGYKPKRNDPGAWEAFKTGARKGINTALQFTGWNVGDDPMKSTVEEELAWQQHPVPYGFGYGGAFAAPTMVGLGAGYAGAKATAKAGRAAAPYVGPAVKAGIEEAKASMGAARGSAIDAGLIVGAVGGGDAESLKNALTAATLVGGGRALVQGAKGAVRQFQETRELGEELKQLKATSSQHELDPQRPSPTQSRSADDVLSADVETKAPWRPQNKPNRTPQPPDVYGLSERGEFNEDPLLGAQVFNPSDSSSVATWIAQRAVGNAPGNLRVGPVEEALNMGLDRRVEARNFMPHEEARQITPEMRRVYSNFRQGRAQRFQELQTEAQRQWSEEAGRHIPQVLADTVWEAERMKLSGPIVNAIRQAEDTIVHGIAPRSKGFTEQLWGSASPEEKFARIQWARELIDEPLKAARGRDLGASDRNSIEVAQKFRDALNESLKSAAPKVEADEFYSDLRGAERQFFSPMKRGKGIEAQIDEPLITRLFGNNPQAVRLREGIETMRQALAKHGNKLPNAQEMSEIIDRFDALRKVAEDKRLLEGLRQAQGPTSPAIERSQSLLRREGLYPDLIKSPASALNSADEFLAVKSMEKFGKRFGELGQTEKNSLIRLLMWHQTQQKEPTQKQESTEWKNITKRGK